MLFSSMKLDSLKDLFVNELKDIYDGELQTAEALPKMIDAASSPELKDKLSQHMKEGKDQVAILEDCFRMIGVQPERMKCDGIAGILEDGKKVLSAEGDPDVKDAAIISAEQKVEHYEISAYGTLRTFASTLGFTDVAAKLQGILDQESKTDELLTNIAEKSINKQAVGA